MTSDLIAFIDYRQLIALSIFAWVSFITTGPNNLWLLSSGASFGFLRTLPHMAGIFFGFFVVNVAAGMGVMGLLATFPFLGYVLKFLGAGYMTHMAWMMTRIKSLDEKDSKRKPLAFYQAALFQVVNPKALSVSVVIFSSYALVSEQWTDLWLKCAVMSVVGIPPVFIWTFFGVALRRFLLERPERFRLFKNMMALLILISIAFVFLPLGS